MSSIERILKAVREVMLLTSDVERMAEDVKLLAREVREHDRRLIRIETMIEVARGGMPQSQPAIAERPKRRRRVAEDSGEWEPAPDAVQSRNPGSPDDSEDRREN